jgi:hypothetical protein
MNVDVLIFKYGGFPCFVYNKKRVCLCCFESDVIITKEVAEEWSLIYDNPQSLCNRCNKHIGTQQTLASLQRETKRLKLLMEH